MDLTSWISIFILYIFLSFCDCRLFKIAWLCPGPKSQYFINSNSSVGALRLALKTISSNPRILGGHDLRVKFFDTECTVQSAMSSAMLAHSTYDPDVIIGPPCNNGMRAVAQMSTFWNIPVFGWHSNGIEFGGVQNYPTLLRMSPPINIFGKALVHLLRQNGWKKFTLLYDGEPKWLNVEEAVQSEVLETIDFRILYSAHQVDSTITDHDLNQIFTQVKKFASIIALACPYPLVRRYMLAAGRLGMTNGDFVFIHLDTEIYSEDYLTSRILSNGAWSRGDVNDHDARIASESLIHIIVDPMNDDRVPTDPLPSNRYNDFSKLAMNVSTDGQPGWELPVLGSPDVYSMFLYDSVVVWSVLSDIMTTAGQNPRDGKAMMSRAKRFFAEGATGYIEINDELDRTGKVYILDMEKNGKFKPVQILRFNASGGYRVTDLTPKHSMFRWGNGKVGFHQRPSDEPKFVKSPEVARTPGSPQESTVASLPSPHPAPSPPHSNPSVTSVTKDVQQTISVSNKRDQQVKLSLSTKGPPGERSKQGPKTTVSLSTLSSLRPPVTTVGSRKIPKPPAVRQAIILRKTPKEASALRQNDSSNESSVITLTASQDPNVLHLAKLLRDFQKQNNLQQILQNTSVTPPVTKPSTNGTESPSTKATTVDPVGAIMKRLIALERALMKGKSIFASTPSPLTRPVSQAAVPSTTAAPVQATKAVLTTVPPLASSAATVVETSSSAATTALSTNKTVQDAVASTLSGLGKLNSNNPQFISKLFIDKISADIVNKLSKQMAATTTKTTVRATTTMKPTQQPMNPEWLASALDEMPPGMSMQFQMNGQPFSLEHKNTEPFIPQRQVRPAVRHARRQQFQKQNLQNLLRPLLRIIQRLATPKPPPTTTIGAWGPTTTIGSWGAPTTHPTFPTKGHAWNGRPTTTASTGSWWSH